MKSFKGKLHFGWGMIIGCCAMIAITQLIGLKGASLPFAFAALIARAIQTTYVETIFRVDPMRNLYKAKGKLDVYRRRRVLWFHICLIWAACGATWSIFDAIRTFILSK